MTGADGGNAGGVLGGSGATRTSTFTVVPGQTLQVLVGGAGGNGTDGGGGGGGSFVARGTSGFADFGTDFLVGTGGGGGASPGAPPEGGGQAAAADGGGGELGLACG